MTGGIVQSQPSSRNNRQAKPSTDAPLDEVAADKLKAKVMAMGEDVYDAVFLDDWPCTKEMGEFILTSDRGAELAAKLANDWELAERIQSLSPVASARELAKLEAGLPATTQPGATRRSPAPPVTPVKPAGNPVIDEDKLSTDEWVKRRRAGQI